MTRHAAVAAARTAKLARHQERLPGDQRLVNRALETETIQHNISAVYQNIQDREKIPFLEMVSDPNAGICAVDEATDFFRRVWCRPKLAHPSVLSPIPHVPSMGPRT